MPGWLIVEALMKLNEAPYTSALHSLLLVMIMQEGRDCPCVFILGDSRHF